MLRLDVEFFLDERSIKALLLEYLYNEESPNKRAFIKWARACLSNNGLNHIDGEEEQRHADLADKRDLYYKKWFS